MEEIKIVCRKCKEEKSANEMKRDPGSKLGFQKICKICENQRNKKYRELQKEKEEWQEKERQRHKKYSEEHKEEIKERQKKIRDGHKEEYYACESCQMLVKNINVHNKTEYHNKNSNNGWKDDKEKKNCEHFQPRIIELKKMFENWKKDLEIEKEKREQEKKDQQKARKREYDRRYLEMKLLKQTALEKEKE